MASKLDTILAQTKALEESLTDNAGPKAVKEACSIIQELVHYVETIQEECIKLLQDRNVEEKKVAQPPFRWDSLRNDTTPFKVPYGPFTD